MSKTLVLIIEDEPDLGPAILAMLNLEGYEAVGIDDGWKGVTLAEQRLPAIILIAFRILKENDYAILKALRANVATQHIPVIALANSTDTVDIRQIVKLGIDDCLVKPFNADELLKALSGPLNKRAQLEEAFSRAEPPPPAATGGSAPDKAEAADVVKKDETPMPQPSVAPGALGDSAVGETREVEVILPSPSYVIPEGDDTKEVSVVPPPAPAPAAPPPSAPPPPAPPPPPEMDTDITRELSAIPDHAKSGKPADGVQFSAYYPKTVKLDDWQPFYAYVFRERAAGAVVADALKQLSEQQAGYSNVTQAARATIQQGAEIVARPEMKGFQFNPLTVTLGFYDEWGRFDFKLRAKDAPLHQFATGSMTFVVEGVIVADVPLSVFVGDDLSAEINSAVTKMYQAIFCSYSHQDSAIVERVERAYKALGLDYLRDIYTLKSGQEWDEQLLKLIDQADIFQLFWSEAAAKSPYVEREWRHALSLNREATRFIRPVYWKQPMPAVPSELGHIHFAYEPELGA
jgi:CheY-like chemotaxis protein